MVKCFSAGLFCLDVKKKVLSDGRMNTEEEGKKVSSLVQAFLALTESLAVKSETAAGSVPNK